MARKLKSLKKPGYPWGEWTNGSAWEAKSGADFKVDPAMFAKALYQHARRKGFKVESHVYEDCVEFQFSKAKAKSR